MKVCHVTFDHFWNDTRVYKREILSQREAGFDVIFFGWDKPTNVVEDGVQFVSYIDHQLSKKERVKLLVFNRDVVNCLLRLNADIYQFHDFTLLEVGRKLKKSGKHVVFDSHENYLETIPVKVSKGEGVIKNVFSFLLRHYYKRVVGKFDAVFTVSPNFVEKLKEYNPYTFLVSNFPSVKNWKAPTNVKKENVIIFQGTVYGFSNQEAIVKAMNLVNVEAKYLVIGNIAGCKHVIEDNDERKRTEIVQWVEKEKLDIILQKSIAGIVVFDYVAECCYQEGQIGSNKIFEYMLNGLPVICTDFRLWKELIIDKYHCGICVKPGDIVQIKEAIEWLLTNPQEAYEMGMRGRDAVLNVFNWEKGLPEYIAHYEHILNGDYSDKL